MLRYLAMPMTLGLCLTGAVAAETLLKVFDGDYRGRMNLEARPAGVGGVEQQGEASGAGPCVTRRPAEATITASYITLQYRDWNRHLIHFRGQVMADGTVKAYHLNSDGQYSPMTGHINGNQFEAETLRGRCYYRFELSKR